MTGVDWIVLAVVLVSLLLGAWRGFVYEVLSALAWLAAFLVAQWFAPEVAVRLPLGDTAAPLRFALAFGLVFIVVAFAGGMFAALFKKAIGAVGLRPVDRVLGMVFGLARALMLLLAMVVLARLVPAFGTSPAWRGSVSAPWLNELLVRITPMLPDTFARIVS